jgi:hypothetical protein
MATIADRLSDLCDQMKQLAEESRAGDVEDVAAIDRRVDRLIDAVGTLAYLAWLAEREQVSA